MISTRFPLPEKPRQKRAVIQDMVRPLKKWLLRHRHNPYPTKAEKVQLALGSNMTLVQVKTHLSISKRGKLTSLLKVSNWFANARRRLKNVVQENHCSWSKRLRMYNQFVQGNAELLSISSDDSIWNSEEDEANNTSKTQGNSRVDVVDLAEKSPDTDENRDSAQYKKTMLHRYLNDSVDASVLTGPKMAADSANSSGSRDAAGTQLEISATSVPKSTNTSSSICFSTASVLPKLPWPPLQPLHPPTSISGMMPWLPMPPFLHYLQISG